MKISKAIYFELALARESTTISYVWQRIKAEEWESFIVGKKEGFKYTLIGGCWQGDAGGGLTGSGGST